MGRYINWDDVTGRYQDAAKLAGDTPMGSYWLERAEHEIDARLAPRYTVPFTPAHPVVQDLCVDLTYFKMIIQQEAAKPVKEYLDERIKGLLNGTILLTTSGAALTQGAVAWSQAEGHHTSFGPDGETAWEVSSQWVQDVEDERSL